jgi:hypothetical protein
LRKQHPDEDIDELTKASEEWWVSEQRKNGQPQEIHIRLEYMRGRESGMHNSKRRKYDCDGNWYREVSETPSTRPNGTKRGSHSGAQNQRCFKIPPEVWARIEDVFKFHYMMKNKTLLKCKSIMEEEHNFRATYIYVYPRRLVPSSRRY